MGVLDRIKKKMDKVIGESKVVAEANESLPSDEQLQNRKAGRRETAENVTSWLSDKGYPRAGAVAGTVIDTSADMIPETREDYQEQMVGSITPMGTISKLKGKLPISEEGKRKAWNALTGEQRDQYGNNFKKYFQEQIKEEEKIAIEAAKADKALREVKKTKAEGVNLSDSYASTKEKFNRPFTDSKQVGVSKVADVEKGAVTASSKPVTVQEKVIRTPDIPVHLGPSHQQQMQINETERAIQQLRKKTKPRE